MLYQRGCFLDLNLFRNSFLFLSFWCKSLLEPFLVFFVKNLFLTVLRKCVFVVILIKILYKPTFKVNYECLNINTFHFSLTLAPFNMFLNAASQLKLEVSLIFEVCLQGKVLLIWGVFSIDLVSLISLTGSEGSIGFWKSIFLSYYLLLLNELSAKESF